MPIYEPGLPALDDRAMPQTIEMIARFFVGFSTGHWERAGRYFGRGVNVEDGGRDALAAFGFDDSSRSIMFPTFASIRHVDGCGSVSYIESTSR
jgi:hypothetical protein